MDSTFFLKETYICNDGRFSSICVLHSPNFFLPITEFDYLRKLQACLITEMLPHGVHGHDSGYHKVQRNAEDNQGNDAEFSQKSQMHEGQKALARPTKLVVVRTATISRWTLTFQRSIPPFPRPHIGTVVIFYIVLALLALVLAWTAPQ